MTLKEQFEEATGWYYEGDDYFDNNGEVVDKEDYLERQVEWLGDRYIPLEFQLRDKTNGECEKWCGENHSNPNDKPKPSIPNIRVCPPPPPNPNKVEGAEEFLCDYLNCSRAELQYTISQNPRKIIVAMNQFVTSQMNKKVSEILMQSEPWPLTDILKRLIDAADILLHKKDYDGSDHEEIYLSMNKAKEWLTQLTK